jgi:hypothetical protein
MQATEFRSVHYGCSWVRDDEHAIYGRSADMFLRKWTLKVKDRLIRRTIGSRTTVTHHYSGIEPTNSAFRTTKPRD